MSLQVPYVKEGLEAIIFTADGDMRQALNNLQATHFGFGLVDSAAVFKVCLLHPGASFAVHMMKARQSAGPDVCTALRTGRWTIQYRKMCEKQFLSKV